MSCVSLQRKTSKFQEKSPDLEAQLLEIGFLCENVVDPDALLETESFTTATDYDALNRATSIRTPHNSSIPASEILPAYNEANLLEKVDVKLRGAATATSFVRDIDYDAKGQRERIQYGNGSTTGYTYDEKTFRLKRLLTTRNNGADVLQDLNYTYDAVGNITQINDNAQQTVFFNGSVVSPSQKFEYDALYRLVKATGREHVSVNADSEPEAEGYNQAQISPQDGTAMRNYAREWRYDSVGNILSIIHDANGNAWTRTNAYATGCNRLASSTVGSASASFSYNAHGSMTSMPHLSAMDWDFAEKLCHVTRGTTDAYYNYDGGGIRTRKVVEKNGVVETRLYLGGFEIWRKTVNGMLETERETLHVMDDQRRIALVETLTVENGNAVANPLPVLRYQLDNHLGSASLELDESANIISYEEYYPYGDTSYRAGRTASEVSRKRYRYTGKEKDEESGLYYHGARYYACWLGRWTAVDPIGIGDGLNVYMYVQGNPVKLQDPNGTQTVENDEIEKVKNSEPSSDSKIPSASSAMAFDDISSLHKEIQAESKNYSDSGMEFGFADVAKWITDPEYLDKFKSMFVYKNREIIKAAAARFDIPAELLAGVMHNEIGGKDPLKKMVYMVRSYFPRAGDKDKTSLGQQAMQVRRAAESLGYDPNALSDNQRQQILKTLDDPVQSIFLAAKHISDLRNIDFNGKHESELSLEDALIIGTRYNRGPEISLSKMKENLNYGKRITSNWSLFRSLLSNEPSQVEYNPIQNNFLNPVKSTVKDWAYQLNRAVLQQYGVPR